VRERGVGHVEHALDVDVDHPLPLLHRRTDDRAVEHHARGVDDHVEPAELFHGALDRADGLLAVGDVSRDRHAVDLARYVLEPVEAPRGHDHLCTWAASARAVATPIPLLAPVTSATVSLSRDTLPRS
jgi:hypothetical protein